MRVDRLLTSHFSVLSLVSGRSVPQPKYCMIRCSTSLRSPFWLAETLGRTSQPTTRVGRGAMDTLKQPSPSTYPDMYDGTSTTCREPAYCAGNGFATAAIMTMGCDRPAPRPDQTKSLRGHAPKAEQRTSHGITRR